jgi:hypothetical protein
MILQGSEVITSSQLKNWYLLLFVPLRQLQRESRNHYSLSDIESLLSG